MFVFSIFLKKDLRCIIKKARCGSFPRGPLALNPSQTVTWPVTRSPPGYARKPKVRGFPEGGDGSYHAQNGIKHDVDGHIGGLPPVPDGPNVLLVIGE